MPVKKKSKLTPKTRIYLQKGKPSASFMLRTNNSPRNPLQYKEKGKAPRSIRYCTNQDSYFTDEQEGDVILGRVVFIDGKLVVKEDNPLLQELLSIHHPHKDIFYEEFDPVEQAKSEVDSIKLAHEANSIILNGKAQDIRTLASALLNRSKDKSIDELKHDLLVRAKDNPETIINLSNDDDLKYLALAKDAIEVGILEVSKDKTKVVQGKSVIVNVPFNQEPHRVLASFLKTKDGDPIKAYIEENLN